MKPISEYEPMPNVKPETSFAFYLEASKFLMQKRPDRPDKFILLNQLNRHLVALACEDPTNERLKKLGRGVVNRKLKAFLEANGMYVSPQTTVFGINQRLVFHDERSYKAYLKSYRAVIATGGYRLRRVHDLGKQDDLEAD